MRAAISSLLLLTFIATPDAAAGQTASGSAPVPPAISAPKPEAPPSAAGATETTEWMSLVVAEERARQFRKAGRAMTAIECRPDLTLDVDSGESAEFRFQSIVNEAGIEWTWREFSAPELPVKDRELANEAFNRVSTCEYERQPSGRRRICALWQK